MTVAGFAAHAEALAGVSAAYDAYRATTVRNIDAWYKAVDVQPGQALYLAPAERVW